MKASLPCYLVLILALSGIATADESKPMKPEDFPGLYEKALGTQDWNQVASLIHPNCTVTFSNGSTHQGKKAVRAAFERNFDLIQDDDYSVSDIHWVLKGDDFAVYTYAYRWSGTINGEPASGAGRGTSTLALVDGSWQLVSEHLGPKS